MRLGTSAWQRRAAGRSSTASQESWASSRTGTVGGAGKRKAVTSLKVNDLPKAPVKSRAVISGSMAKDKDTPPP